eukprot:TRINITY_DN33535_c0_g2_i8.p5 TRINITY_DN33535_c0_g2~~TRINITY_DN33535_c0_g2_i8.p5  ORF type:complete len:100 (-),score=2.15 TRINITY_DN33535_c0_g2_i8:844-1143(-)
MFIGHRILPLKNQTNCYFSLQKGEVGGIYGIQAAYFQLFQGKKLQHMYGFFHNFHQISVEKSRLIFQSLRQLFYVHPHYELGPPSWIRAWPHTVVNYQA